MVLRAKEILADRPHGHIMQAKAGYEADENIASTTPFAFGDFNSHLTHKAIPTSIFFFPFAPASLTSRRKPASGFLLKLKAKNIYWEFLQLSKWD